MNNRELNALVAEKVMEWIKRKVADGRGIAMDAWHSEDEDGWMTYPVDQQFYWSGSITYPFEPLTDIASAWLVFLKLCERGITRISNGDGDSCDVAFLGQPINVKSPGNEWQPAQVIAETFEKAISLTALKACGVELEAGEGEG